MKPLWALTLLVSLCLAGHAAAGETEALRAKVAEALQKLQDAAKKSPDREKGSGALCAKHPLRGLQAKGS
jgi:hypothetical protein